MIVKVVNKKDNIVVKNNNDIKMYIGRGGFLGNPFSMKNNSLKERERVIKEYEKLFFSEKFSNKRKLLLSKVRGKENIYLECFCSPLPCHGDVIKRFLEEELWNLNKLKFKDILL